MMQQSPLLDTLLFYVVDLLSRVGSLATVPQPAGRRPLVLSYVPDGDPEGASPTGELEDTVDFELRLNASAKTLNDPPQVSPLDALRGYLGLSGTRAGAVPARCSPTASGLARASRWRCSASGRCRCSDLSSMTASRSTQTVFA